MISKTKTRTPQQHREDLVDHARMLRDRWRHDLDNADLAELAPAIRQVVVALDEFLATSIGDQSAGLKPSPFSRRG